MLSTSWNAAGRIQPIWDAIAGVEKGRREELARLTGISPSNLSGINTGRLPLTMENATRIVRARPGVTLADLGAPEDEVAAREPLVLDRLEELATKLARALEDQTKTNRQIVRLQARVRRLENRPWPGQDAPTATGG